MLNKHIFISNAAAFTLTVTCPVFAQSPPAPPAHLDLDVEALTKQMTREMLAKLQNPPAPPSAPQTPRPPRPPQERRGNRSEATEDFARNFKVGAGSTLLVANTSGNITVTAGSGNEIDVKAVKRGRGANDEEAKRRLANTEINASASGNRVEIRVEQAERSGGSAEVEFQIKVPPDCAVDLRSISGNVSVTNVKGELRTNVISGDVSLESTPRIAAIKAISGNIQITSGGGDAATSVSTVSGDVTANGLAARSLDLNTVSGDFRITGWAGDRVNMRSMSGDINLSGALAKGGRYDMESHSGDIRLVLNEQPGFAFEADTFSGRIQVDFSMKTEGPVRDRNRGPRSVRGSYGDSSASVRTQTFSGDISVTRK